MKGATLEARKEARGPPKAQDGKASRESEAKGADYLIYNFSGKINVDYTDMYLSDEELAIIASSIKTGWGALNKTRTLGRVYTSEAYYLFTYNPDNSITIQTGYDMQTDQEYIDILEEVLNRDKRGKRTISSVGEWLDIVRSRQGRRPDNNGDVSRKTGQSGRVNDLDGGSSQSDTGRHIESSGEDAQRENKKSFQSPVEAKESGEVSDAHFSIEFAEDIAENQRSFVDRGNAAISAEELDAIAAAYAVAYGNTNLTSDEIWQEMICDSLADMNIFDSVGSAVADMVADFLPEMKGATLEARKEARGPPAQKNTADGGVGKMSIDSNFYSLVEKWDKKTIGFSFVVGETSKALQEAGIPKKQIRMDASKIVTLFNKHSGMTIGIVKQIPELLEHPIVVVDSKKNINSKIVMGDLYDENGKIVTAVLLLTPTSKKGNVLDFIKISSSEGRGHISSLFTYEDGSRVPVRYVDKKRIQSWLNVNGLQLPLHNLGSDSNISISQNSNLSTPNSKKVLETFSNNSKAGVPAVFAS